MPVYNGEKYLKEAVESVLEQTLSDFELIIVDDCSTDATSEIIAGFSDSRIVYLRNEKNLKISDALNRGISAAVGEYIARMDADDISMPERFEIQARFLDKNPDVSVVGCGIELFGAGIAPSFRRFSATKTDMEADLIFSSPLAHPSVMFRRSLFWKEGFYYDPEFNGMEDYDLFWRISRKHRLSSVPDILLRYRLHGGQITQNYGSDIYDKTVALKRKQFSDLGAELSEAELNAFVQTCLPKSDLFGVRFEDIASSYKKLLQVCKNKKLKSILTDKLLLFSKYTPVSSRVFSRFAGHGFSRFRIAKNRLRRILKKPYIFAVRKKNEAQTRSERNKLPVSDFTVISNNCWAGSVYRKYGLPYLTPTAGLLIFGEDYVKFCRDLKKYISYSLEFIPFEKSKFFESVKSDGPYPVAKLGDIEVYFMHYRSPAEAREKWERRCKRVNFDRIVYKLSERENVSAKDIKDFMALPLENKLCFSSFQIDGAIFVPELASLQGDETELLAKYFDVTEYFCRVFGRK